MECITVNGVQVLDWLRPASDLVPANAKISMTLSLHVEEAAEAATERAVAERSATERAVAERAAMERTAAERVTTEKATAVLAAAQRAVDMKVGAAEATAEEEAADESTVEGMVAYRAAAEKAQAHAAEAVAAGRETAATMAVGKAVANGSGHAVIEQSPLPPSPTEAKREEVPSTTSAPPLSCLTPAHSTPAESPPDPTPQDPSPPACSPPAESEPSNGADDTDSILSELCYSKVEELRLLALDDRQRFNQCLRALGPVPTP